MACAFDRADSDFLAVLDADQMPNELFYENVDPDDLNRIVIRQWQQYLYRRGRQGFDPVFAVWHALAGAPAKDFAPHADATIKRLAADNNLKIAYAPGGPYELEWKQLAAASSPQAFCESYRLDVCAPTDDRNS